MTIFFETQRISNSQRKRAENEKNKQDSIAKSSEEKKNQGQEV